MGLLYDFFGVECEHTDKHCVDSMYAASTRTLKREGKVLSSSLAKVELWECNNCNEKFLVDWGDNSFKEYDERK